MAHALSKDSNGRIQFMYAGKVPWHGLGKSVGTEVTAGEAIVHAGLNYEYEKIQLQFPRQLGRIPQEFEENFPGAFGIIRVYDRKPIGVVGKDYCVIQPKECFDFLDRLVGEGQALYHTAGAIFDGRIIFMTMKLPEDIQVGSDKIEKWLFLSNVYDGSAALTVQITPIRVVCANTYSFAMSHDVKARFAVRHTKNYEKKIQQAQDVLGLSESYFEYFAEKSSLFLETSFKEDDFVAFAEKLFPATLTEDGHLRVSSQTKNNRSLLTDLFYNGPGQEAVKETKWAALNAVTDYVDHHANVQLRDRHPMEARINSAFYGNGQMLRQKAFELLSV